MSGSLALLNSITLASLLTVSGGIYIVSNDVVATITFNSLSSVSGYITITDNPLLTSVSMNALGLVGTYIKICSNGDSLSVPTVILEVCPERSLRRLSRGLVHCMAH